MSCIHAAPSILTLHSFTEQYSQLPVMHHLLREKVLIYSKLIMKTSGNAYNALSRIYSREIPLPRWVSKKGTLSRRAGE
ncbi:hypothetical protein FGO68_gene16637 [Halteria grandinella]|uniref:Uncharacterized protein n=1 Tax=Halteria grandinella TaxID=5974 RepID=A0A8J8P1C3_HALGN|nr:hypothetical protein FGO68_gene16637 [Halteria grandinella]